MLRRLALALMALVLPLAAGAVTLPDSPLDRVEALTGRVEIQGEGTTIVINLLRETDLSVVRSYIVQTAQPLALPLFVATDGAHVYLWRGHLLVNTPEEQGALHFSIPSLPARPTVDNSRLAQKDAASWKLAARLERAHTFAATAIISRGGPAALIPAEFWLKDDPDQQDPGSGGLGSCGTSCSMTCGDGSHCSVSCTGIFRCAHCSCPANCNCS